MKILPWLTRRQTTTLSTIAMQYITHQELADLLLTRKSKSMAIIDVRDEDFAGGKIRGAMNFPSDSFDAEEVAEACTGKEIVVVHCMLSQQRGPRCAQDLANVVEPDTRVLVLRGGIQMFIHVFRKHPQATDLLEDYNDLVWFGDEPF